MEKYPLLYQGRTVGELTVRPEGEDTLFSVFCRLPEKELWCFWAVGREGTLRLGCPEQQSGEVRLSRRFSRRMTAPLGKLSHGELRKAAQKPQNGGWESLTDPERHFHTPWLVRALGEEQGGLTKPRGSGRLVALPFSTEKPFPLVPLFCFGRLQRIQNRAYIVYAFNAEEWPVGL